MKKKRRTREEMREFRTQLYDLCEKHRVCTVRQVFYLAVSAGLIPKNEEAYKQVGNALTWLRKKHILPYRWLADHTRHFHGGNFPADLEEALEDFASYYRKSRFAELTEHIEVWTEKETLTGVLFSVTDKFGVRLYPSRGYASLSFLYSAAREIDRVNKPTFIYHLGDWDPSGVEIGQKIESELRRMLCENGSEVEITFTRLAVNPDQVEEWNLPTRPTKKTDTRAKKFRGKSVEVEAVKPDTLRSLVQKAIESHIPEGHMDVIRETEESEREAIRIFTPDIQKYAELE